MKYRMIDLCSGIGGIRRGFELSGNFINVLAAEIDHVACTVYKHMFGESPYNDLTSCEFKNLVKNTDFDVLLAGFPCQAFSRAGLQQGFEDIEKGNIFFHIEQIIQDNRPKAFLLENVDHLITHDSGRTIQIILEYLVNKLRYHIVGVTEINGELSYSYKTLVRNSRYFGVPQNRPRVYLLGFNKDLYKITSMPTALPEGRAVPIYSDLTEVLETDIDIKFFMSQGYFDTLKKHAERQKSMGNGFGYRIVNALGIQKPIANTLLATGGSGKERNLIYDPLNGPKYAGKWLPLRKTPINNENIRVMTPTEWGKLQGFVNYAFIDKDGKDIFSIPEQLSHGAQYRLFGNSVTIPVIEEIAKSMLCVLENTCRAEIVSSHQ